MQVTFTVGIKLPAIFSKEDFLVGAILYYLKNINEKIELKKELEIWEKASDEDFLRFEQKI